MPSFNPKLFIIRFFRKSVWNIQINISRKALVKNIVRTYQSKTLFGSLELELFFKVLFGQYRRPKCSSGKCLFQNHRNYTSMNIFKKTLGRLWNAKYKLSIKNWSKLKFWYFLIDWMNTWIFDIFDFQLPRKLISVSRKNCVFIFTKSQGLGTFLLVRDSYPLDSSFFFIIGQVFYPRDFGIWISRIRVFIVEIRYFLRNFYLLDFWFRNRDFS